MIKRIAMIITAVLSMSLSGCNGFNNVHSHSEEYSSEAISENVSSETETSENNSTESQISEGNLTESEINESDSSISEIVHHYSSDWSYDEFNHWHVCTDEGYEDLKSDEEPHSFHEDITDPTYESGGYITHTCIICGYSYVDSETSQLIHNYSSGWSHDETSHWHACIDEGYEDLKSDEEPHSFRDKVINPTFETCGYTSHTCIVCGYYYEDNEISPLQHSFSSEWSFDESHHWHACTDEGYDFKMNYGNHQFEINAVNPTYESGGYTVHTCTICGYSFTDNYTSPFGHTFSGWDYDSSYHWCKCIDPGYEDYKSNNYGPHEFEEEVVCATYEHEGYTKHTCKTCGYNYTDGYTNALVHQYSDEWSMDNETHWNFCTDPGYSYLKGNESNHTFEDFVHYPTYTDPGYTYHFCSVCGYSYTDGWTENLVHHYSDTYSYDECSHWYECTDDGYDYLRIDYVGHTFVDCVVDKEPTIFEEGLWHETCSVCGYVRYSKTAKLVCPHKEKSVRIENKIDSTCTSEGSYDLVTFCLTCYEEISRDHKTIPAANHHFEGLECTKCHQLITDICENDIGLNELSNYPNGENIVTFYSDVNSTIKSAFNDLTHDLSEFSFNYKAYGLSTEEALIVCDRINLEHPLYYFLSQTLLVDENEIIIQVSNEYVSSSRRLNIQNEICDYLNMFANNDVFDTLLKAHDYIIDSVDYEFDRYNNPSEEAHAHNIIGVIEKEGAVCDGYARAFQLVCDCFNIPSLIATGRSDNQKHAWNVVQIDDQWYWVDVTWDDCRIDDFISVGSYNRYETGFDYLYDYFLVPDNDFLFNHSLDPNSISSILDDGFMYELENRANTKYISSKDTKLHKYFEADDIQYQIVTYDKVSVSYIDVEGDAIIPESVEYDGVTYDVISIGSFTIETINDFGDTQSNPRFVVGDEVLSLYIPSSVRTLYEEVLTSNTGIVSYESLSNDNKSGFKQNHLKQIIVSEDNPYFCSYKGVLYSKDMKWLLAYPFGCDKTEYIMPNSVIYTDFDVFNGISSLEHIHIGQNYYARFASFLSSMACDVGVNGGYLTVSEDNPYYYVEGNIIYSTYDVLGGFGDKGVENPATAIALADITQNEYRLIESFDKNGVTYNVCSIIVGSFKSSGADGYLIGVQGTLFTDAINLTNLISEISWITFDGYCIYYYDQIVFIRGDLESIIVKDGTETLYSGVFNQIKNVKSVTIPLSVTHIEGCAFPYDNALMDIYYEGTIEQWYSINIEYYWDYGSDGEIIIHCSDGDITKTEFNANKFGI